MLYSVVAYVQFFMKLCTSGPKHKILHRHLVQHNSMAVEGFYAEINGIKQNLVSSEVEIFADQHIQNPLKSALREKLLALFVVLG